jgi:MoxR-vWA-beta-propeller ternary system domain bpX6
VPAESLPDRVGPPYHGQVQASAYVIDAALLGTDEARRRVLAHWESGAGLRELVPGRWLFTLAAPSDVDCARAPGLPLRRGPAGGLTAGNDDPPVGIVRVPAGGATAEVGLAALPVLDPGDWLDLSGVALHQLEPVQQPPPPPTQLVVHSGQSQVDLRAAAGVGPASERAIALTRRRAPAVEPGPPGHRGRRGRRGETTGGQAPAGEPALAVLARLAMRTALSSVVRRRHERYLAELTRQFRGRQYAEALRDAIAVGGAGSDRATLGLPRRRPEITGPTPVLAPPGGSVGYGGDIHAHLIELYRKAAADLEADGQVETAAFVFADLLHEPREAVVLLERHRRYRLAAELAEGRELDPALVVRLWWRAGDRDRAVMTARRHGAFATAVHRLSTVDKDAAGELRQRWAAWLRAGGDHLGAVEALWPEPELRPAAATDIQAGLALGGPAGAHLFAYLLTQTTAAEARTTAVALLGSRDPDLRRSRDRFLAAFAGLPAADPVADREVASAALRALHATTPTPAEAERSARDLRAALLPRADPMLAADLPPLTWHGRNPPGGTMTVDAVDGPGQLPVHDAVLLAGGAVLVAHGSHGARLLTVDGRVRAEWDVPTDRLVVADHGGSALLAARIADAGWELSHVDIGSRRVRRWAAVRAQRLLPSFDGARLTLLDPDHTVVLLDVLADRPAVLWTELSEADSVIALERGPTSMAALVGFGPGWWGPHRRFERWQWSLPDMALRARDQVEPAEVECLAVTPSGALGTVGVEPAGGRRLRWHDGRLTRYDLPIAAPPGGVPGPELVTGEQLAALLYPDRVELATRSLSGFDLTVRFGAADRLGVRGHAGLVTCWDSAGRIVGVDPDRREVMCNLRTRL